MLELNLKIGIIFLSGKEEVHDLVKLSCVVVCVDVILVSNAVLLVKDLKLLVLLSDILLLSLGESEVNAPSLFNRVKKNVDTDDVLNGLLSLSLKSRLCCCLISNLESSDKISIEISIGQSP